MSVRRGLLLLAALLGAAPALAAPAKPRPVARFAIVIGNNRPEDATRPALRYADDDAVATHRLLTEAGVNSVLLTRFDADTLRFQHGVVPAGAPRFAEVVASFAVVGRRLRAAAARGQATELLVFYSGHGDTDGGEGYLLLEDRRLTRTLLQQLLARSPADRHHVIIDACKSYYMVFDRGPGGRRRPYAGTFLDGPAPGRSGRTGFVLSTSSDRDSHEWERYQAGVFSHQVRSALRGAADVNRDGVVSYAELGAFLTTASASIANPRFRPDFLVQPPGRDLGAAVLQWPAARAALLLDTPRAGHVFVESARGERLADTHPAAGQTIALHLPPERPLFVRRNDGTAEYVVADPAPVSLGTLAPEPVRVASRGALHVALEQLFAVPFDAASVAEFRRAWEAENPAPVTVVDEPRPRRKVSLRLTGWTAVAAAVSGAALGAVALERSVTGRDSSQAERQRRNEVIRPLSITAGVLAGVAVAAGVTWLTLRLGPPREGAPRLAAVPTADGAALVVGGAW